MAIQFEIREAVPGDAAALSALAMRTFEQTYRDHFARDFSLKALAAYLDATFSLAKTKEELADSHTKFFIVENRKAAPVGYMKLADIPAPKFVPGKSKLCLQRIFLESAAQRTGLGSKLIKTCVDYAQKRGYDTIWLGCWDGGIEALKFYEKSGFKRTGQEQFFITGSEFSDIDLILVLPISA